MSITSRIVRAFVLVTALLSPAFAVAQEPLAIGSEAPLRTRSMRGTDGATHTIQGERGRRGTLVVFTCNHCPWAQAWEERITALGNTYRGRGIGVIAINPNDPAQHADDGFEPMQARARERGMQFPYVVDDTSEVARAFGATRTPEVFLFGADGHLVYHGAVDDNAHQPEQVSQHYLRDALEAVVAGRPVATATTRSMGCTIKFRPARG